MHGPAKEAFTTHFTRKTRRFTLKAAPNYLRQRTTRRLKWGILQLVHSCLHFIWFKINSPVHNDS